MASVYLSIFLGAAGYLLAALFLWLYMKQVGAIATADLKIRALENEIRSFEHAIDNANKPLPSADSTADWLRGKS